VAAHSAGPQDPELHQAALPSAVWSSMQVNDPSVNGYASCSVTPARRPWRTARAVPNDRGQSEIEVTGIACDGAVRCNRSPQRLNVAANCRLRVRVRSSR
jgi:hypothetical protein